MKTIRQDPGSLTEKKSQCEWMLGNSTHTTPGIKALIGVVGVGLSITANISNLHFLYLRTSPPPPRRGSGSKALAAEPRHPVPNALPSQTPT